MKKFFWLLGNIAAFIIAIALYGFVQEFYFYPQGIMKTMHVDKVVFIVITTAITVVVLVFEFSFYRRQLKEKNYWGFNQKPHWKLGSFVIALLGVMLLVLASIATQLLLNLGANTTSTNQAVLNSISRQAGIFYIPMVTVLGPIFEETIFRGLFFNIFFSERTRANKWVGIMLSGFIFGFIHDPKLTKFIFVYWALGCILAWVYMTTKDLRYSIISHILYNAIGFF